MTADYRCAGRCLPSCDGQQGGAPWTYLRTATYRTHRAGSDRCPGGGNVRDSFAVQHLSSTERAANIVAASRVWRSVGQPRRNPHLWQTLGILSPVCWLILRLGWVLPDLVDLRRRRILPTIIALSEPGRRGDHHDDYGRTDRRVPSYGPVQDARARGVRDRWYPGHRRRDQQEPGQSGRNGGRGVQQEHRTGTKIPRRIDGRQ